jgi:hypothetical protein
VTVHNSSATAGGSLIWLSIRPDACDSGTSCRVRRSQAALGVARWPVCAEINDKSVPKSIAIVVVSERPEAITIDGSRYNRAYFQELNRLGYIESKISSLSSIRPWVALNATKDRSRSCPHKSRADPLLHRCAHARVQASDRHYSYSSLSLARSSDLVAGGIVIAKPGIGTSNILLQPRK